MALTKAHNRMIDGSYANVMDFGAVSDGVDPDIGTDNAVAFQAAIDTGRNVFIPKGNYRLSTVTIPNSGQQILGEGMGQTFIHPMNGYSALIVASDHIEISNLEFRGKTGTGQFEAYGDCIKFDAVTNNPAFARHMEGCKVERVKFRNLKFNAIYVPHLLRESQIRECRFVGIGDNATNRHPIKFENQIGSGSNINNIWIDKNMFYRFATEAIKGFRSTILAGSAGSFADIWITNNLIHGQLLGETGGGVEPELTNQVTLQDSTTCFIINNNFTSLHPLYQSINISNAGLFGKAATIIGNHFSAKTIVDGVTYSRTGPNYANGEYVSIFGVEAININNNEMYAGVLVRDIFLANGDYTTSINVNCTGNTSQAGSILVDHSSLGAINVGWNGVIEQTDLTETTNDLSLTGTININADAVSNWSRDSNALALRFKYNNATNGAFIGSPASSNFQVSSDGGTPLLVVQSTNSTRPGANNIYSLGNGTYRWSEVFATNGTINTSDERQKQDIEALSEAEKRVSLSLKSGIKKFRWKDAVEKKGDAARIHVGVIAQEVMAAFEAEGLDSLRYGIICYDEWEDQYEDVYEDQAVLDDEGNPTGKTTLTVIGKEISIPAGSSYGVRYEQLLAFIISSL